MSGLNLGRGLALAGVLLVTAAAWAQGPGERPEPRAVPVRLMVTHLSDEEGGVDPSAHKLQERLRRQGIRYKRMEVVEEREVVCEMGEVCGIDLPDGRGFRMQPILSDERGTLMAVDVEDGVKADMRVRRNHMVVIDGGGRGGGKDVISIELDE